MKRQFSFQGRANRNEYVAACLGLGLIWVLAFAATSALVGFALAAMSASSDVIVLVVISIFALSYCDALVAQAALTVRRLHDIGVSGRWLVAWFLLLGVALVLALTGRPSLALATFLVAMLLGIVPTVLPGAADPNRFGDPPAGDDWRRVTVPDSPAPRPSLDERLAAARHQLEQAKSRLRR